VSDFFSGIAADAGQWLTQGTQAVEQGRFPEAIDLLDRALAARPQSDETRYQLARALNGQAMALAGEGRFDEALPLAQRAVATDRQDIDSANILGYILVSLERHGEAIDAYMRAAELGPQFAEIWFNLATTLMKVDRLEEAEVAFGRVLALDPGNFLAMANRGFCLALRRRCTEAAQVMEEVLRMQPNDPGVKMALLANRIFICDWRDRDELREAAAEAVRTTVTQWQANKYAMEPFESLALYDDPELHKQCAEAAILLVTGGLRPMGRKHVPAEGKIRLGYLSSDFHNHATTYLMAEVFEHHDRDRFELVAFSTGPIKDDMTARLRPAFDAFHSVPDLKEPELAALIERENIEILVDLKGFTGMGRTSALAGRPAPVQVNYLGFPGTLGADFVDYIIGDPWVTPPGSERFYTEKVVRLPHSYQPNSRRPEAPVPTRAQAKLPDNGTVFCCFNSPYKISPDVFSSWMRILEAVPGSVLWLLEGEVALAVNLRREAKARGVDPERLVFAPYVPLAQHMARLGLADIVLDTTPYNAHTTCSDALRAGVPVVTSAGPTFASRVAASLLNAAGVPELNRPSWADYEAFAIALGHDRAAIEGWKAKLRSLRDTSILFNIPAFTRDLEAAYVKMSKRWRAGLPPEGFDA
jgi:predicted O-linked N-acetylglucosamine transferase (SPINDLY family)